MKKYFWILFFGLLSCNSIPTEIKEDTIFDSKTEESQRLSNDYDLLTKELDHVRKADKQRLELYLQLDSGELIKKVPDFDDSPETYYAAYNLIRNKSGKVIFLGEYPASESGDWNLSYENFYDQQGNLIAFVRLSSFFNGECTEIVREKSEYIYNPKHELIKKTYKITDGDNKPIDSKKCVFDYRFDYKKYMTLTEYLKDHQFENYK